MLDHALALRFLLTATARDNGDDKPRRGVVSRIAARATGRVMDVVDADAVLAEVDVDALMERIDVDALLDRVDINALLDRVDPNALLDRVDPNALLDRVDPNTLLDRVDADRLMARIDVAALVDRIDVEELVQRSGIPEIVRESTGVLAGSALDVVRRQLVSLDLLISRVIFRVTGRRGAALPNAPPNIEAAREIGQTPGITGNYAGPVTRLFAFLGDMFVVWGVFTLVGIGIALVVGLFAPDALSGSSVLRGVIGLLLLAMWIFSYFTLSLAIAGRTIGMSIIGLLAVTREGDQITPKTAVLRGLVYPFSFLVLGLGLIGILIGKERRALHDAAAGTVVVYDWGDRPAEVRAQLMQWLERHNSGIDPARAGD